MIKQTILAITAVAALSSTANAGEWNFDIEQDARGEAEISLSYKVDFGKDRRAEAKAALENDLLMRKIRAEEAKRIAEEAKTRKTNADAMEQETEALAEKMEFCLNASIRYIQVPATIATFCGDLLP